ncbi:DEAD/DEAH box helicase family protein [Rubellimicrobium aerolatum]|uniref:DEAD/DEAH box helicase n=1 Tax=Rubellimicrobium aerolatum TaxID=490979 RepID=A0ABW0SGQ0_9RHOB|nr:DEAD/DEAH box helicase family protein [Rubellimicrobium aerolatum]MBP1807438.1 type III restriction enzyme [Rubellimicrobium aerolatum]
MDLKTYQQAALDALRRVLDATPALGPARAFAQEVARQDEESRLLGRTPLPRSYAPLPGLPDVPHVCLRLPTGGGKTLLAGESLAVAAPFLGRDRPFALWLAPSDMIRAQTVAALKDPRHPYRARLDAHFGRVRVLDVAEFESLLPQDLATAAVIVVATIQAFRVTNTLGRKVYGHREDLEPHFGPLPTEGMETVAPADLDAAATRAGPRPTPGAVKFSFANLCHAHRPVLIVDEAHNAVTGLTREMQARLNPSLIVELTATPRDRQNILFSVTAQALKDEEMIKLPIRVRPHPGWEEAVRGAVATRNLLTEKAKQARDPLRPIVLYQAQDRTGHPTADELRAFLIDAALAPAASIAIATGDRRDLDGVDLGDPACPIRHVITVDALREGWDCPQAYVLCATQRLRSATAVEQILGRVLRMPGARRRADPALNMAYAHVSEPDFTEVAASLGERLTAMGFTDDEVRDGLRPAAVSQDAQGALFDPDPVAPRPVLDCLLPDTPEARATLGGLQEAGVDYLPSPGGLRVGVRGDVAPAVAAALAALTPLPERPALAALLARHEARVEAARSPADRGAVLEVPFLAVRLQGELFRAESGEIFDRADWSPDPALAILTEADLAFDRSEEVLDIDMEGERLRYSRSTRSTPVLPGLPQPPDAAREATLVQWLTARCRAPDLPEPDLHAWLARLVGHLLTARGLPLDVVIDWQHPIAAKARARLDASRAAARRDAYQSALFGPDADLGADPSGVARFDRDSHADLPTVASPFRYRRHLLGPDRIDPGLNPEEIACAQALDSLPEVEVWTRNPARHRSSFWLPTASDRFYPDFVARLTDGRLLVVEYKGDHLATAADTREKALIGALWATRVNHLFTIVERARHGEGPEAQLRRALAR